jgi:outer membrane translocation and assembly module TamA
VVDSAGFERESLETTYRRHRLDGAFGGRLPDPADGDVKPAWRFDWTSEIASPDRLGGDFDFTRHIVSGRARVALSSHQEIAARAIVGWSSGVLPPQRQFAIGGIGTVHGYEFKEAVGDALSLANLEYALGGKGTPRLLAFFDVGRVSDRLSAESRWLKGAGFGFGFGSMRLDFGYPLESGRSAPRILLRLERSF